MPTKLLPPEPKRQGRNVITLYLLIGITITIGIVVTSTYQVIRNLLLDSAKQKALLQVQQGASEIDFWLGIRKAEIATIASTPIVATLDWKIAKPFLLSELQRIGEFKHLTLALADGSYYTTLVNRAKGKAVDRVWFQNAMAGKITANDPIISRSTGFVQINITAPIPGSEQPLGVISGAVLIDRVVEIIEKIELGENSYAFALNSEGQVIVHPDPALRGTVEKPAPSLLNVPNQNLAAIAREMVAKKQGVELVILDGIQRYVAFTPLKEANWSVALVLPQDTVESSLQALNILTGILGGVLFLAATGAWRQFQLSEKTRRQVVLLEAQEKMLRQSEARNHAFLQAIPDMMFRVDREGTYLDFIAAKGQEPLTPRNTLIGSNIHEVLPAEVATLALESTQLALSSGQTQVLEYEISQQGQIFDYEARLVASDANEVFAIVRDISDRKRTEAVLKQTLAEAQGLNAILDNLADGLLVTDTAGKILRFNLAFLRLYDLQAEALQERTCEELSLPGLAELVEKTQCNPRKVFSVELELANQRIGQAVATTIFRTLNTNESQDCFGSAILIRDVTSEKEVDRMKTDFISTVSHELRTPLTSVLGFAAIIKEKLEQDIVPALAVEDRKLQKTLQRVTTNLNIIVAEAERLTSLINDVLDIAKMEAGKVDWNMQSFPPAEILDRAIAATSALFETSGLELRTEIAPNLPEVVGDRDRLIQVMINLISNAVKFTPSGSVTCKASVENEELCIEISDTGIGIAPEDQGKVFERFQQVGDTLTDKPKGTGLGLPICKQIIEHHKGRIWVESELRQGSTFSFTLPLDRDRAPLYGNLALNKLVKQLRDHVITSAEGRKTILIVDDDPSIRELLRQQLEAEGYEVHQAKDGMDALQQVKSHPPDLIVLDVMMPQINGFDVAAVLKNDPKTAEIPIIILSIVEDRERGYRLGIDRYLTKPIHTNSLLDSVSTLLIQGASSKKVLIVDENASTLRTLSEVLQTQGYSVTEATNYRDCIEKALVEKPDMIIVDSLLSQEGDLIKTLRFEKGLENVFFLVLGNQQDPGNLDDRAL